MNPSTLQSKIGDSLTSLYGNRDGMFDKQLQRYASLLKSHAQTFGSQDEVLFVSAPGRTEICGNHTDHNHGKVLAAAVNLDALAAVSPRPDMLVSIYSKGHPPVNVNLEQLAYAEAEKGTSTALVRGIASWLVEHGFSLGGFDAVTTNAVFSGSGLSSSAAFEVLVCAIFSALYNDNAVNAVQRAQCAQYAENEYFGKPSGLMDQMASSMGSLITIDFANDQPKIDAIPYDFSAEGFALVVVSTGGSHDDLTHCYAAIPQEMRAVAAHFGKSVLREVPRDTFFQGIPSLRKALPAEIRDRAILRAQHFYTENDRVDRIAAALRKDDLAEFLQGIILSGQSSMMYLQNIYASPDRQEITLALMIAEELLKGKGAWRVHGGGFAGTTLNFVPLSMLPGFVKEMEAVFGAGSATTLDIRPRGAVILRLS